MAKSETKIIQPRTGVACYRNPDNDAAVIVIHYTADKLKRDPSWADEESRIYAGGKQSVEWLQEYEIDFEAELRLRTYWGFDEGRNIVPRFELPESWPLSLGFDFGGTSPTCVLFYAQNPLTGEMVIWDELYETETPTGEMSRRIYEVIAREKKLEHLSPIMYDELVTDSVGDPSGHDFAIEYAQDPWPVYIRTKGVKSGYGKKWQLATEARVNEMLVPSFACCGTRWYPAEAASSGRCGKCKKLQQAGSMLTIMEGRAPNLVRTLPTIMRMPPASEHLQPEERDDKGQEDHAPDANRYRIAAAVFEIPEERQERDLLNTPSHDLKPEELIAKAIHKAQHDQEMERLYSEEGDDIIFANGLIVEFDAGDEDDEGIYAGNYSTDSW